MHYWQRWMAARSPSEWPEVSPNMFSVHFSDSTVICFSLHEIAGTLDRRVGGVILVFKAAMESNGPSLVTQSRASSDGCASLDASRVLCKSLVIVKETTPSADDSTPIARSTRDGNLFTCASLRFVVANQAAGAGGKTCRRTCPLQRMLRPGRKRASTARATTKKTSASPQVTAVPPFSCEVK